MLERSPKIVSAVWQAIALRWALTFDQPITDIGDPPSPANWGFLNGVPTPPLTIEIIGPGKIALAGGGAVAEAGGLTYYGPPPPIYGTTTQALDPFTIPLPFP